MSGCCASSDAHPIPRHRLIVHDDRADLRHLGLHPASGLARVTAVSTARLSKRSLRLDGLTAPPVCFSGKTPRNMPAGVVGTGLMSQPELRRVRGRPAGLGTFNGECTPPRILHDGPLSLSGLGPHPGGTGSRP